MIDIRKRCRQRVAKHRRSFSEPYAVLSAVRGIFARVPFKRHPFSVYPAITNSTIQKPACFTASTKGCHLNTAVGTFEAVKASRFNNPQQLSTTGMQRMDRITVPSYSCGRWQCWTVVLSSLSETMLVSRADRSQHSYEHGYRFANREATSIGRHGRLFDQNCHGKAHFATLDLRVIS
jgi:hypothetical protein